MRDKLLEQKQKLQAKQYSPSLMRQHSSYNILIVVMIILSYCIIVQTIDKRSAEMQEEAENFEYLAKELVKTIQEKNKRMF